MVCAERLRAHSAASQSRFSPFSDVGRHAVTVWKYVRAKMAAMALSVMAQPPFNCPNRLHGARAVRDASPAMPPLVS